MVPNDPNGYDWHALGYTSLEAFIEAKAGASPCPCGESECQIGPWPMPEPPPYPADDEGLATPLPGVIHLPCRKCGGERRHFGAGVCWSCMTPTQRERLGP